MPLTRSSIREFALLLARGPSGCSPGAFRSRSTNPLCATSPPHSRPRSRWSVCGRAPGQPASGQRYRRGTTRHYSHAPPMCRRHSCAARNATSARLTVAFRHEQARPPSRSRLSVWTTNSTLRSQPRDERFARDAAAADLAEDRLSEPRPGQMSRLSRPSSGAIGQRLGQRSRISMLRGPRGDRCFEPKPAYLQALLEWSQPGSNR
jgi:hypothetical protein